MTDDHDSPTPDLPAWVVDRLTQAYHRIQNLTAGQKLWYERFTDADRAVFTEPWPVVWATNQGTIGLWCRARGTSWNRAIAEVAHTLGFLDQASRDALVAALPPESRAAAEHAALRARREAVPSWHKGLGELRYRGEVIRAVKPEAENLRTILDAFELDGWPSEIYDPLRPDEKSDRRRRAVGTLNNGLRGIRFSSTGGGRRIAWKPVADEPGDAAATA
ncbi:MAG: hypothetical protein ACKOD2_18105 [Ilumatobacteraceae bacterium]